MSFNLATILTESALAAPDAPAKRQAGASGAARADSVRMVARLKLIPAPNRNPGISRQ